MLTKTAVANSATRFRALGDPTRLRILELVAQGEQCVCELASAIDVPQPLLSHHLRILREAGFITVRKEGRWNYYAMNRERLEACVCTLEGALATYDESARLGRPGCACSAVPHTEIR
jgi:ArsR family transcriptional regulator